MKIRGKKFSRKIVLVLASVIAVSLIASGAGLLNSYGKIESEATVGQSVTVNGKDWDESPIEHEFSISAGCKEIYKYKIKNNACVEAPIELTTDIGGFGQGIDGVDVKYYIMPGEKTLHLENKNADWEPQENDNFEADVTYNPCCPNFKGTVDISGIDGEGKHALVYYRDQENREENWGDIEVIATFTGDGVHSFNKNLGKCLPEKDDWNIGPDAHYDWSTWDDYDHGKGAKLWIIPFSDISGIRDNTVWNQEEYLFETDLIGYFDCNINPIPNYIQPYFDYESPIEPTTYTLQPGEEICLFIEYNFDVAAYPGVYTVTTEVIPN